MSTKQTEDQKWPCPHCGYTKEDAAIQMDHHLCKGPRSSAPGATSRPCDSNAELKRRRERVAALEAALKAAREGFAHLATLTGVGYEGIATHGEMHRDSVDAALSGGTAALDAVVAEAKTPLEEKLYIEDVRRQALEFRINELLIMTKAAEEATRELQQRIEQLEAENRNWKMRANYDPCPNCAATEGMGFVSRGETEAIQCMHCNHRGPEVSRTNWTKDTDWQVVKAWNDEFRQRQAEMRAELTATRELREERDALALKVDDYQNRLAMIRVEAKDQTLRTPFIEAVDRIVGFEAFAALALRDAKTLAKGRAEGKREGLLGAASLVRKYMGGNTYLVAQKIDDLAAQAGEVTHESN